jgi:hypothetical protein
MFKTNLDSIRSIRPVAAIAAMVAAVGFGGCQYVTPTVLPPHFDQTTVDDLNKIKTDSDALSAQLQKPQPDCLYANSSAGFDTLDGDIAAAKTQAATIANNTQTVKALTDLAASAGQFRAAVQAGATNCLPANLVTDWSGRMDKKVQDLVAYEQNKPH